MQIQVSEKKESLMKNLSLETKDTLPLTTEIFRFNTRFKGFNMNSHTLYYHNIICPLYLQCT